MSLTYSVPEAAVALGIGQTKLRELIAAGEIPTLRIGRRVLIAQEDLHAAIARYRKVPGPTAQALAELADDDGRIDLAQIPQGTTLADLEAAKRIVAERKAAVA